MEKSKFTRESVGGVLINAFMGGDPPSKEVCTFEKLFNSIFSGPKYRPESMDIGTPEGWVRCYSDGRYPEFITDHAEGADPRESARKWFADKGL